VEREKGEGKEKNSERIFESVPVSPHLGPLPTGERITVGDAHPERTGESWREKGGK